MKEKFIEILEWLLTKLLTKEAYSRRHYLKISDVNIRIANLNETIRQMSKKKSLLYYIYKCRKESLQIRKHQVMLNIYLGRLEHKIHQSKKIKVLTNKSN